MTSNATLVRETLTPVNYPAVPVSFIQHPANIPLKLTATQDTELPFPALPLGLICNTPQAFTAGTTVEISSPLAPEMCSRGEIVWCRPQPRGFQVAIAFQNAEELYRIRMLEQLCHIDHYRRSCKDEGTPKSRESAALEWIEKFAAHFPTDGL